MCFPKSKIITNFASCWPPTTSTLSHCARTGVLLLVLYHVNWFVSFSFRSLYFLDIIILICCCSSLVCSKSVLQFDLKRFWQTCNSKFPLLQRKFFLYFWKKFVLMNKRSEEQKKFGFGQGLSKALSFANRKGHKLFVLLDISFFINKPLRSENGSISPIISLQDLCHHWVHMSTRWNCLTFHIYVFVAEKMNL